MSTGHKSGDVTIKWEGDRLTKKIDDEMARRVKKAAVELQRETVRSLKRGKSRTQGPAQPGQVPHSDTGRLANSVMMQEIDRHTAMVGTNLKYGLFLEVGADIRPKSKKALAIPISKEARKHSQKGMSARDFPKELVLIDRDPRPPLLVEKKSDKVWVIHYLLTTHVVLRPHPWLRPNLEKMRPKILEILMAPFGGGTAN